MAGTALSAGWRKGAGRAWIAGAILIAALGLFLLTAAGCGSGQPRPDVVVIVIDTLRTDHLDFNGYARGTTPFLSMLVKEGVFCARAHSTSSWTAPATASLLTSLHPVQHGVLSGFLAVQERRKTDATITLDRIPDAVETLAEALGGAGYRTFAVTDNRNICDEMGFAQGFEHFRNMNYNGASAVNEQVLAWADQIAAAGPYLLYLHYMDPHRPYHQHDPQYRSRGDDLQDQVAAYDSEIAHVDGMIRELYKRFGWDRNTLLVITSDHGEEFQDHGGWDHGRTLYREVMDVPLIFVLPGGKAAGTRLNDRVSLLDVLPTVRGCLDLPPSQQDQGVDLLPRLTGGAAPADRLLFAHLHSAPWFGDLEMQAVIAGDRKLIVTQPEGRQLFDLGADPQELEDLSEARPEAVAELWREFQARRAAWIQHDYEKAEAILTPEDIKKLKSLGYAQ